MEEDSEVTELREMFNSPPRGERAMQPLRLACVRSRRLRACNARCSEVLQRRKDTVVFPLNETHTLLVRALTAHRCAPAESTVPLGMYVKFMVSQENRQQVARRHPAAE